MKKTLSFFAILLLVLVTGCSNTNKKTDGPKVMTCTKEETDDEGYKTEDTMVITYNSEKVLKVESSSLAEMDPDYVEFSVGFASIFTAAFDEIEGIDMSITKISDNKVKTVMNINFETLDYEKIKEMSDDDEDSIYSQKDITIDDFKGKNLEGYTCK